MSKVAFLSTGDITDCLRIGWNSPKLSEILTMLVIVETSMDAHCLRKQVRIGSESDCLLGQPRSICEISALVTWVYVAVFLDSNAVECYNYLK